MLSVTALRPYIHYHSEDGESHHLMHDVVIVATAHENSADVINEIAHGIHIGREVDPFGNGGPRSEKNVQSDKDHPNEPHHKYRLLHSIVVVEDKKPKALNVSSNNIDSSTKIIAVTTEKNPFAMKKVKKDTKKTVAVFINEVHSSTADKGMAAVTKTLSQQNVDGDATTGNDIANEIRRQGEQPDTLSLPLLRSPSPPATVRNTEQKDFRRPKMQGQ